MSAVRGGTDPSPTRGHGGSAGSAVPEPATLDAESRVWLNDLRAEGSVRDRAAGRLHELLLRVARAEAVRRRARLPGEVVEELDDLCVQAASDAVVAVLRKLDEFRGTARFTTWACKFVILEFSTRLRRRVWRGRPVETDGRVWERLADATPSAQKTIEHRELLAALGQAVERDLTERQRLVFTAAVLDEVPIDVLAERLDSNRGAIYKVLHDARSKLRDALAGQGYAREVGR